MKYKYYLIFINFILSAQHLDLINNFIANYKRDVTILEIANSPTHGLELVANKKNTVISICLKNCDSQLPRIKKLNNFTLLSPYQFALPELEMLGRCEHFDLLVVHDLENLIAENICSYIELIIKLADNCFIVADAKYKSIIRYLKNRKFKQISERLFFISQPKLGLDVPRWRLKPLATSATPRYFVESNFEVKKFHKSGAEPQNWIPGINLKTFVMLRGIHPDNNIIYKQLLNFKQNNPHHNDLVIGNLILQGTKIIAIDFNDKRRNANMDRLLARALNLFDNNLRLRNPTKAINKYDDDDY